MLSTYEKEQHEKINSWKIEEPGVVAQGVDMLLSPLIFLAGKVVPVKAIEGALSAANWVAEKAADESDIVRDAGVSAIPELLKKDLAISDKLANEVHNWAIGIASSEGGATGASGAATLIVDIPFVITFALRTIHKIGLCYGYRMDSDEGKMLALQILSASGANSMKEKAIALCAVSQVGKIVAKQSWKRIAEEATMNKGAPEMLIVAIRAVAKQLGVNLTKRKALQLIPVVGAIVGASVNGWWVKEVGWAARRVFQERWLVDNEKIIEQVAV